MLCFQPSASDAYYIAVEFLLFRLVCAYNVARSVGGLRRWVLRLSNSTLRWRWKLKRAGYGCWSSFLCFACGAKTAVSLYRSVRWQIRPENRLSTLLKNTQGYVHKYFKGYYIYFTEINFLHTVPLDILFKFYPKPLPSRVKMSFNPNHCLIA